MSDNDLIRRGDALKALDWGDIYGRNAQDTINAITAVQPTVKPLRYIEPEGETLEQMRDHARQHPLAQSGDMRLVWVNEGDLHMHTIFHGAQPTVSPELLATTHDVAALVEALRSTLNFIENTEGEMGVILGCGDKARTALARVKGETK